MYATDAPEFQTKYSNLDVRQKVYSGWSVEGILKFRKNCEQAEKIRAKKTSQDKEQEILALIQAKYELTTDKWEDKEENQPRKKKKTTLEQPINPAFENFNTLPVYPEEPSDTEEVVVVGAG